MLKFLDTSRHYVAAEHISSFPQDGELGGWRGRRVRRRGEKGEGEWVEGRGEKGRSNGKECGESGRERMEGGLEAGNEGGMDKEMHVHSELWK